MDKKEIIEILNEVERLKGNISECDKILIVLRDIQQNYENAIAKPKELLDKIDVISLKVADLIKDSEAKHNQVIDSQNSLLEETTRLFSEFMEYDKECHENVVSQNKDLLDRVDALIQEYKESLIGQKEYFNDLSNKVLGFESNYLELKKQGDSITEKINESFNGLTDKIDALESNYLSIEKKVDTISEKLDDNKRLKVFSLISLCTGIFSSIGLIVLLILSIL